VYASLVASFLVVVWGGVVRVTGSGLGCPDWPLCHGQFLPSLDPATRIEWFHRFLAIAGGLTVAATVLWSFVRYRADRRVLTLAIAVAVLYPLQAVLAKAEASNSTTQFDAPRDSALSALFTIARRISIR